MLNNVKVLKKQYFREHIWARILICKQFLKKSIAVVIDIQEWQAHRTIKWQTDVSELQIQWFEAHRKIADLLE